MSGNPDRGVTLESLHKLTHGEVDIPFALTGDDVPNESHRQKLIPAAVMAPPILWLCSAAADAVTGNRYVAADWDTTLPPEQAEQRCRAPIAWPHLAQNPVWPGGRPAA